MENLNSLEENIFTVSYLSTLLKVAVENQFGFVKVRGELSGVKRHTSGHLYFTLKDQDAILDGVSWKGSVDKFGFMPSDGLEVICTGKITTYAARSKYQMVVSTMAPAGEGALLKLFEDLKKKLALEKIFDVDRKKPIPTLPKLIGIITSPTGAVIKDMLHRLQDRCPRPVLLWPVLVQGDGAAAQIATAISGMNHLPLEQRPDLLIVGRGGGSLEDLWAFNEEIVVRAIAASQIPIISAVGHETDTTLSDFAADLRAPTPTAAAELAVPVRRDILLNLNRAGMRSQQAFGRSLEERILRIDDRFLRLQGAINNLMHHRMLRLNGLNLRSPMQFLEERGIHLGHCQKRLAMAFERLSSQRSERLLRLGSLLESYSFQGVLKRGFALVRSMDGQVISTVCQAQAQETIEITFQDGCGNFSPKG